jgi:hypothetical protein
LCLLCEILAESLIEKENRIRSHVTATAPFFAPFGESRYRHNSQASCIKGQPRLFSTDTVDFSQGLRSSPQQQRPERPSPVSFTARLSGHHKPSIGSREALLVIEIGAGYPGSRHMRLNSTAWPCLVPASELLESGMVHFCAGGVMDHKVRVADQDSPPVEARRPTIEGWF